MNLYLQMNLKVIFIMAQNGGKILLTFDDGFKSNRKLAEEVLEMNKSSIFHCF